MKLQRLQISMGNREITFKRYCECHVNRKKGIPMESLLRTSSTPVDFAEGMRAVVKGARPCDSNYSTPYV